MANVDPGSELETADAPNMGITELKNSQGNDLFFTKVFTNQKNSQITDLDMSSHSSAKNTAQFKTFTFEGIKNQFSSTNSTLKTSNEGLNHRFSRFSPNESVRITNSNPSDGTLELYKNPTVVYGLGGEAKINIAESFLTDKSLIVHPSLDALGLVKQENLNLQKAIDTEHQLYKTSFVNDLDKFIRQTNPHDFMVASKDYGDYNTSTNHILKPSRENSHYLIDNTDAVDYVILNHHFSKDSLNDCQIFFGNQKESAHITENLILELLENDYHNAVKSAEVFNKELADEIYFFIKKQSGSYATMLINDGGFRACLAETVKNLYYSRTGDIEDPDFNNMLSQEQIHAILPSLTESTCFNYADFENFLSSGLAESGVVVDADI